MSHTTVRFRKFDLLNFFGVLAIMLAIAGAADAGGTATTIFDGLATATDAAVFGPLGRAVIGLASIGGAIYALVKGAWLFAGMGIAIAGLMVGAQMVAGSSGFGALI